MASLRRQAQTGMVETSAEFASLRRALPDCVAEGLSRRQEEQAGNVVQALRGSLDGLEASMGDVKQFLGKSADEHAEELAGLRRSHEAMHARLCAALGMISGLRRAPPPPPRAA